MRTLGFSHYNLRAPKPLLEQLRAFYCDVVGLSVGDRPAFASFGYWLYAGEHDVLHLTETRSGEQRSTDAASTFDHAAFRCSGRAEFERKLRDLAIAFEVKYVPGTQCAQIFLRDPAGNGVELNFPDGGA